MKIRKKEKGPVEYLRMEACEDCGEVIIKDNGEEIVGSEFLANGFQFVEIERSEIPLLNKFLSEAGERLRVGWEYTCYTMDKEASETEEGDESKDEGNEEEKK